MDATQIVMRVARAVENRGLDAVLIGNAGAAMHGAPVTTIDIDFLIRRTPANRKKLTAIAADLGAVLYRPIYPISRVVRMMNDDETLHATARRRAPVPDRLVRTKCGRTANPLIPDP